MLMKRISTKKSQSRGHSGFVRVLTIVALMLIAATGAWAQDPTYAVKMANATDAEAVNWTIASGQSSVKGNEADGLTGLSEGAEVTVSYSGRMKVKSVTATTDVLLPTDLSKLTAAYTAQNGEILTGTTSQEILIAAGATVTLKNATVNYRIKCLGTATIILADGSTNTVNASNTYNAGIVIGGEGTTLTIDAETVGDGKLTVQGGSYSAGIGTGSASTSAVTGGNIVINGGTITANAGSSYGTGIGTGYADKNNTCGDITINGGTVTAIGGGWGAGIGTGAVNKGTNTCGAISITGGTVTATGGSYSAGIGTGQVQYAGGSCVCGNITITNGVKSVTANKGTGNGTFYSIGIGKVANGTNTCGTITIGGVVKDQSAFTAATYTYPSN